MKYAITFATEEAKLIRDAPPNPCCGCAAESCRYCDKRVGWDEQYGSELQQRNLLDAYGVWQAYQRLIAAQKAASKNMGVDIDWPRVLKEIEEVKDEK